MTFVRLARWAPLAALTLAPAAGAQPAPAPTPAPTPVVITMGADGKPTVSTGAAAAGPTGYYHYDDLLSRGDDEPVVIHTGPTPELHVVRRGDTLWDICWYYFSDPWQWPKVWSYNGQITNPHWIHPRLVRLLPKG
jgi:nucleoid-associated protein YgaU